MEGGGTDLRCREVCRRVRIEIDSMVDKSYGGFQSSLFIFGNPCRDVELFKYLIPHGEEMLESTWMRGAMTFS